MSRLVTFVKQPTVIAAALAVLLIVIGEVISPGFAGYSQVISMLRVASFLGVIAIGQTIVILSGGTGIDLSVGKVATFAAIIASRLMQGQDSHFVSGVIVALSVCVAIGAINGLGIVFLGIPPFVMTLGMLGVVQGLILAYTGGVADGRAAPILTSTVNGSIIAGVPGVLIIWALLTVAVWFFLNRTRYGWDLYSVGANRVAARLTGIRVRWTIITAYMLASLFAGIGGILMVGYTETVFLNLADNLMLPSVAAVIIGGTLISGGVGGYVGSAIGAVVLTVLESLLTTLSIDNSTRTVINGAVLIALLTIYGRQKKLRS